LVPNSIYPKGVGMFVYRKELWAKTCMGIPIECDVEAIKKVLEIEIIEPLSLHFSIISHM